MANYCGRLGRIFGQIPYAKRIEKFGPKIRRNVEVKKNFEFLKNLKKFLKLFEIFEKFLKIFEN